MSQREFHKRNRTPIGAACASQARALSRTKKQKRPQRAEVIRTTDANAIAGRPHYGPNRTCGFDTLQYDGLGVPYGRYCH
jgi:hypothetical protein